MTVHYVYVYEHQDILHKAHPHMVDMSGWSEGSKDKGEVYVKCEGVGGVGWGPQESGNPHLTCHLCSNTHNTCRFTISTPAIPII